MSGSAGGGAPRRAMLWPRQLVSTCQPQPRPWEAFLQHEARAVPVFHVEGALSTSGCDPGLERNLPPAPCVIVEMCLQMAAPPGERHDPYLDSPGAGISVLEGKGWGYIFLQSSSGYGLESSGCWTWAGLSPWGSAGEPGPRAGL